MKIYKCASPSELENSTRDGWTLEQVLSHDTSRNVNHSAPAQVVNNNNQQYGGYQSGMTVPVDTPVIVREPVFLLSKESEVESREIQLQNLIKNIEEKHKENLAEYGKVLKERDQYRDEADRRTTALNISAGAQQKLDEQKRKLEGDLAKVQKAIGDLKYFEIVGGPVPTK